MADEPEDECTCIPDDAVVLRELCVIEYMLADGEIRRVNYSHNGAGEVLDVEGTLFLAEWAKADALAPIHAMAIAALVEDDE